MNANQVLTLHVKSLWDLLGDVRARVDVELENLESDLRQSAVMVVSELVANALKYGRAGRGTDQASLTLTRSPDLVAIRVSSLIRAGAEADAVIATVKEACASDDPAALYQQKLVSDPVLRASARFGLYRITGEGGFTLAVGLADGRLNLEASRKSAA